VLAELRQRGTPRPDRGRAVRRGGPGDHRNLTECSLADQD
jgi:hypothetical protein